jgi:hypothetical protein
VDGQVINMESLWSEAYTHFLVLLDSTYQYSFTLQLSYPGTGLYVNAWELADHLDSDVPNKSSTVVAEKSGICTHFQVKVNEPLLSLPEFEGFTWYSSVTLTTRAGGQTCCARVCGEVNTTLTSGSSSLYRTTLPLAESRSRSRAPLLESTRPSSTCT